MASTSSWSRLFTFGLLEEELFREEEDLLEEELARDEVVELLEERASESSSLLEPDLSALVLARTASSLSRNELEEALSPALEREEGALL